MMNKLSTILATFCTFLNSLKQLVFNLIHCKVSQNMLQKIKTTLIHLHVDSNENTQRSSSGIPFIPFLSKRKYEKQKIFAIRYNLAGTSLYLNIFQKYLFHKLPTKVLRNFVSMNSSGASQKIDIRSPKLRVLPSLVSSVVHQTSTIEILTFMVILLLSGGI